jgi:hypothetical protein
MSRGKSWCFTLNNFSDAEYRRIVEWGSSPECVYLVVGRERGASGTPHLQGYMVLDSRKRLPAIKAAIGGRAHIEAARGSPSQNREYCTKEGDFTESGTLPVLQQGKRSDVDRFKEWVSAYVAEHDCRPPESLVALEHTALWLRYQQRLVSLLDYMCPPPRLVDGDLRPWQSELFEILREPESNNRAVRFYVDEDGEKGKSWFCRYCLSKLGDRVQLLSVGKRDDLAHAVNVEADIFLINIPRGQMEFLRYEVLESLKDQTIFSPKYQSTMKVLLKMPHVVVFCNEYPDMNKMTRDRYVVIDNIL